MTMTTMTMTTMTMTTMTMTTMTTMTMTTMTLGRGRGKSRSRSRSRNLSVAEAGNFKNERFRQPCLKVVTVSGIIHWIHTLGFLFSTTL